MRSVDQSASKISSNHTTERLSNQITAGRIFASHISTSSTVREYQFEQRVRSASYFEATAAVAAAPIYALYILTFYTEWTLRVVFDDHYIFAIIGLAFFEIFSLLLTGRTILAGIGAAFMRQLISKRTRPEQITSEKTSETAAGSKETKSTDHSDVRKTESKDRLNSLLARSASLVKSAERRPNALLFVGTAVSATGLIFFLVTLPGFLVHTEGTALSQMQADAWKTIIDLLPRVFMLIFIQVLAGFFLRQYRSSMEDLRYYESLLRQREGQALAYLIRLEADGDKEMIEFANDFLEHKDVMKLQQGETHLILETQKAEANEFKEIAKSFLNILDNQKDIPSKSAT